MGGLVAWFDSGQHRMRNNVSGLLRLLNKERRASARLPIDETLRLWRRGFLSESGVIYGFPANDAASEYLSDYARFVRSRRINGMRSEFLNDKLLFHAMLSGIAPLPRCFGAIVDGRFVPLQQGSDPPTPETLNDLIAREKAAVLKPRGGGGGKDVRIIRLDPNGTLMINGLPAGKDQLDPAALHGDLLATEFIEQADYARDIFPATTNTIRFLTMIEPESGKAFVAAAVHRFGSSSSGAVDNWSHGGLSCPIDLASGRLGPAIAKSEPARRHDRHPDTGAPISTIMIPGWPEICREMLRIANFLPFIPYIGWDVIVTATGFAVIEGNSHPDVNLVQVHQPLLKEPRIAAFYRHHGVVRAS